MNYYVSYDEMKDHLEARQKHHEGRAEFYTQKMVQAEQNLKDQLDEAETVTDRMHTKVSNMYTGVTSERDQARNSARSHAQKATIFEWKRKHLPAETSFLIDESEASQLEFIASSF